jgi:hypothetical protein
MGGTLTKSLPVGVAASTPVLVTGWNVVVVVVVARRAHCWVLRQPAGPLLSWTCLGGGGGSEVSGGHESSGGGYTRRRSPVWGLSGSGAHGLPGGFVRCLRTA